jgi:hypothetical protein
MPGNDGSGVTLFLAHGPEQSASPFVSWRVRSDNAWCLRRRSAPFEEKAVRADDYTFRGALGLTADRKTKTPGSETGKDGAGRRANRPGDANVSDALRNAYQQAVGEDVPQEFLDLLGKLA